MNPGGNPFKFLEALPPEAVARHLSGEMGFVQGAALSLLSPVLSAKIIACLPENQRREVTAAMSKSRQMPRDVLCDIADELQKKLGLPSGAGAGASGKTGNAALAESLKNLAGMFKKGGEKPARPAIPPQSPHLPHSPRPLQGGLSPARSAAPAPDRRKSAIDSILSHTRGTPQPAAAVPTGDGRKIDGMALAAHILREAGSAVRDNVMHELPELYRRLHERMFDFPDLERSDAAALGRIFTGIDAKIAALALRFASDTLQTKVFAALSSRRADLLRDEMAAAAQNRVKLTAIDEAQQAVIDYAIHLQKQGQIVIDPDDPDMV